MSDRLYQSIEYVQKPFYQYWFLLKNIGTKDSGSFNTSIIFYNSTQVFGFLCCNIEGMPKISIDGGPWQAATIGGVRDNKIVTDNRFRQAIFTASGIPAGGQINVSVNTSLLNSDFTTSFPYQYLDLSGRSVNNYINVSADIPNLVAESNENNNFNISKSIQIS